MFVERSFVRRFRTLREVDRQVADQKCEDTNERRTHCGLRRSEKDRKAGTGEWNYRSGGRIPSSAKKDLMRELCRINAGSRSR
jgi:hypothetical protein